MMKLYIFQPKIFKPNVIMTKKSKPLNKSELQAIARTKILLDQADFYASLIRSLNPSIVENFKFDSVEDEQ